MQGVDLISFVLEYITLSELWFPYNVRVLCLTVQLCVFQKGFAQCTQLINFLWPLTRYVTSAVTTSAQMLNRKLQWRVVSLIDIRVTTNALDMPLISVGMLIFPTKTISLAINTCRKIFWYCNTGEIWYSFSSMGNNTIVTVTWNQMTAML
jgi:hypothetical protein